MMREAFKVHKEDFGHIPLHQQALAWGVRDGVEMPQPANDAVFLRYVKVN
jgi:peptide/nickel transport system substrate-binding protein